MKKNNPFGLNIGASSILVIIVILCLVCFAGLSLASANADYQLSKKLADRTSSYYEAVSLSYQDIYNKKESSDLTSEDSASKIYSNSFNLNENQVLEFKYSFGFSDANYEIQSFKIVNISEPKLDESLSLLLGK